jgi:hypothetical protein
LDALGDCPAVFRFERDGLEDQQIKSALDKIGWLCHMPRLPTIVDDQSVVAQAGYGPCLVAKDLPIVESTLSG